MQYCCTHICNYECNESIHYCMNNKYICNVFGDLFSGLGTDVHGQKKKCQITMAIVQTRPVPNPCLTQPTNRGSTHKQGPPNGLHVEWFPWGLGFMHIIEELLYTICLTMWHFMRCRMYLNVWCTLRNFGLERHNLFILETKNLNISMDHNVHCTVTQLHMLTCACFIHV